MVGRFPYLWAFSKKFLEVIGAGLASAVVAGLLGQTDKPSAPAPSLSPVVYLAPADAQMITLMHNEQSALLQRLRSEAVTPASVVPTKTPVAAEPVTENAIAPPLPPSAPVVAARRESKPHRPAVMAAAKRSQDELSPVLPMTAGRMRPIEAASNPPMARPTVISSPAAQEPQMVPVPALLPTVVEEASDWFATLKQIPGRFWPTGGGLLSEAPRPPAPVGNFLAHVM